MLAFETALRTLLAALPVPAPATGQEIPLEASNGRYLAATVHSPRDLPSFDNSAMDGWAVRSADVQELPARLKIQGQIAAGQTPDAVLKPGHTFRIFTGSPLPPGADAVAMQEDARMLDPETVEILDRVKPWENVRLAGEDVRRGSPLITAGTRIGPAQLALLAAVGMTSVPVYPQICVAILPNGSELLPLGSPYRAGGVYESNALALAALIAGVGATPVRLPPPPDELPAVVESLRQGFSQADIVVTAGGASVGDHDLVKPAFESLGGDLNFWRVALKPGKPFFFGTLPRAGRSPAYLFGVPGNPVSAFVTTVLLVLPALRRMLGAAAPETPTSPGVLIEPLSNPESRRHFIRIRKDGAGGVRSSGPQGSHLLVSLAAANGLVDVPPHTQWPAGTPVQVWHWD